MIPEGTTLGELSIEDVFIEYDGPQLFSSRSEDGKLYMVNHIESLPDRDTWLFASTTEPNIKSLKAGEISYRDIFQQGETFSLVTFRSDDPTDAEIRSLQRSDISDDLL